MLLRTKFAITSAEEWSIILIFGSVLNTWTYSIYGYSKITSAVLWPKKLIRIDFLCGNLFLINGGLNLVFFIATNGDVPLTWAAKLLPSNFVEILF